MTVAWTIEISDSGDVMRVSRTPQAASRRTVSPEPRVSVERDARGPCAMEVNGDPVGVALDALRCALIAELDPDARMVVERQWRQMTQPRLPPLAAAAAPWEM